MIDPIERLVNDAVVAEIDLYMKLLEWRFQKSLRDRGTLDDPIANRVTALLDAATRIGDAIDNREYELPFPEVSKEEKADLLTMIRANGAHWWVD